MNLESLINQSQQGQDSQAQPPPSTPIGGLGSQQGNQGNLGGSANIQDIVKQMSASGLKKTAGAVWALMSKIGEAMLPLYGVHTPEGKKVLSITKQMSSLTQGATSSDIGTAIKSLMQALPANLQGLDINGIISQFQNKTQGNPGNPGGQGTPTIPLPGQPEGQGLPPGLEALGNKPAA